MAKPAPADKLPSVSRLLQISFQIYRANFSDLAGYVTWLLIPYLGLVLLAAAPSEHWLVWPAQIILTLIQIILWLWIIIILVSLIRGWLNSRPLGDERAMANAWRLIPAMAFIAFLQLLILTGGLLILIVPGLIFFVWFAFAQPALILDKKLGLKALTASRELSRGRFWRTAWLLAGGPLIFLALFSLLLGIILAAFTPLLGMDPAAVDLAIQAGQTPIWMQVIGTLSEIYFVAPVLLIYLVVLYEILKKSKVGKK